MRSEQNLDISSLELAVVQFRQLGIVFFFGQIIDNVVHQTPGFEDLTSKLMMRRS
jgi:hypothetical protein